MPLFERIGFLFHQTCLHKRIRNDISKHMLKKKINSILAKNHFCNIWHKLYISKKRKRSNSRTFLKSLQFVTQIFCTKFVKSRKLLEILQAHTQSLFVVNICPDCEYVQLTFLSLPIYFQCLNMIVSFICDICKSFHNAVI